MFTGFSIVKEGKHIPTGEAVAIKVIDRSKYNTNDGGLEREIQVLQKVDHHPCAS
jgi:serine/threonine protein kinase